jgi:hypothetical protein
MGLKKDAFIMDGLKKKALEEMDQPENNKGLVGARRIQFVTSEDNYQYIKAEADRIGIGVPALTSILVHEAIESRKAGSKLFQDKLVEYLSKKQ